MVAVIIAAGGRGKRFGRPGGKQYYEIDGNPVLFYTLNAFLSHPEVSVVLPVVNEDELTEFKETVRKVKFADKLLQPAIAGKERYETVFNGLESLKNHYGEIPEEMIVLIHDGARPCVSKDLISRVIEGTRKYGACIPVIKVADTVKEVDEDERVVKTLDRSFLRLVQTPQGFKGSILYEAYSRLFMHKEIADRITDDAALVELSGYDVYCVEGDRRNIKLTYPEDIPFVKSFIDMEDL